MSRLGCTKSLRDNRTKKDLQQELDKLIANKSISADSIFDGDVIKNREWIPMTDKVKISTERKRIKFRKLIDFNRIDLDDFFRQLILIVYDRESRSRLKFWIGFSWLVTDENKKTEYIACRRSKLVDDWSIIIDSKSKMDLLEQFKNLNLNDYNNVMRQAVNDHVSDDDCTYRIAESISDEDVKKAEETILTNKKDHLRCSGLCAFKKFKSAVAMYVEIKYRQGLIS